MFTAGENYYFAMQGKQGEGNIYHWTSQTIWYWRTLSVIYMCQSFIYVISVCFTFSTYIKK